MDRYAARLICAAVMIGAAALSATLFSSAEVRTEDPRPLIAIAAQAQEQTSTQAKTFFVALHCDTLEDGEAVQLYDAQDNVLQTLYANGGKLTAGPLAAGAYRTWQARLGSVSFTLRRNASVTVTDGNGWSDGEVLYLTDGQRANVCVTVRALTATLPADGRVLSVSLENDDGVQAYTTIVLEKQSGYLTTRRIAFDGVAPGAWRICCDAQPQLTAQVAVNAPNEWTLDVEP